MEQERAGGREKAWYFSLPSSRVWQLLPLFWESSSFWKVPSSVGPASSVIRAPAGRPGLW